MLLSYEQYRVFFIVAHFWFYTVWLWSSVISRVVYVLSSTYPCILSESKGGEGERGEVTEPEGGQAKNIHVSKQLVRLEMLSEVQGHGISLGQSILSPYLMKNSEKFMCIFDRLISSPYSIKKLRTFMSGSVVLRFTDEEGFSAFLIG